MDGAIHLIDLVSYSGLMTSLVLLAVTWFMVQLLTRFFTRLGDRFSDRRLLIKQIGTLLRFTLYAGGISAALLLSLNLTDQMMLALGGTIAVTLGIAFKDLATSVVAGVIILIDKPFSVGDRIRFGEHYGEVVDIGLRTVRLVTLEDCLVTVPNSRFLTDPVKSSNVGKLDMLMQMDFYIGADQPVAPAKAIVAAALTSCRYAYLAEPWTVIVQQVIEGEYFAVRLRAKVHVLDVRYEEELVSDVNERVLEGFRRAGIRPPARLLRDVDRDRDEQEVVEVAPL
jgi:small-conductance mechanosensitive channel